MVKTRFAPAPTGYLHLGGARTALFNWLYARKNNGRFVLRIEDTDVKREKEDAVSGILEGLKWLGINWDEGPYLQSERISIYKDYVNRLLLSENAYPCFCTKEELEQKKKQALEKGETPGYDGKCRVLTKEQREALKRTKSYSIRFLVSPKKIIFSDLIRGGFEFDARTISDFIILRSDGIPTYNFACVIDDSLMEISHIIRGEDHISNTPKQILLYEALGFKIPQFAHLPLIFGPDRTPLSKRHGAMDVLYYKEKGFLEEAMINYISLLGFSTEDSQQIMSRDELISLFSFDRVSRSPAIFDIEKARWMNGEYIRNESKERLLSLLEPYLLDKPKEWKEKVVELYRERIKTLEDIKEEANFLLKTEIEIDKKAEEEILRKEEVLDALIKTRDSLSKIEVFNKENCENVLRSLAQSTGISTKKIFHPLRVCITGRAVSPPLFDCLELVSKELVLKRLDFAIQELN